MFILSSSSLTSFFILFFFFNDTATTEIYTLSLHDALPIYRAVEGQPLATGPSAICLISSVIFIEQIRQMADRKSTRLNSSHVEISYAVFCLKKKKKTKRSDCNEQLRVYYNVMERA